MRVILLIVQLLFSVKFIHANEDYTHGDSIFMRYLVHCYLNKVEIPNTLNQTVSRINDKENTLLISASLYKNGHQLLNKYLAEQQVNSHNASRIVNSFLKLGDWTAKNYLSDSFLVNTDSIAYFDSSYKFHINKLNQIPVPEEYKIPYQLKLYKMLPDSLKNIIDFEESKVNFYYLRFLETTTKSVYMTKPLFLFDNQKCFVGFQFFQNKRNLYVLFAQNKNKWFVERVLFDGRKILD